MFFLTSPETPSYNCIAWAAGDCHRFWWPSTPPFTYWPPGVPRKEELDCFVVAFSTLGYQVCSDGTFERGFEKVAIFADVNGKPTHAARQVSKGDWTSKLGRAEDIRHTVYGLEGAEYGDVVTYMKRPIARQAAATATRVP